MQSRGIILTRKYCECNIVIFTWFVLGSRTTLLCFQVIDSIKFVVQANLALMQALDA